MIAEVILAEFTGVVTEVQQELGKTGRAGAQIRNRAGNLGQVVRQESLLQRARDVVALAVEPGVVHGDRRASRQVRRER